MAMNIDERFEERNQHVRKILKKLIHLPEIRYSPDGDPRSNNGQAWGDPQEVGLITLKYSDQRIPCAAVGLYENESKIFFLYSRNIPKPKGDIIATPLCLEKIADYEPLKKLNNP